MSSLTGFVKRIRDIMWNDAGVNGDAQRIEQMAWILFLKVYNTKEEEWRYTDRPYTSIIPEECRWNNWAADDKSGKAMTGDTLLDFVNNKIKKDKHESVIFRRDNSHYEKLDGMERCIDDELPFEIPESWAWVRWGAIAESIQYGYNAPAKQEGRIRMVRISDIHENTVAWSSVPFCDIDDSDIPTYLLQANDILFARTGGTVGKSFLVSEVPCESIYAGYLIRTRYSSLLCPQYLKYFMESPLYWQQLKSGTTATAQPNCNGQTLASVLQNTKTARHLV